MYEYLRGTVVTSEYPYVVLDVGGIGYRLSVPLSNHRELPEDGEVLLYAYLYVREDQMTLYGFTSREQRSVFERLISVSGVGPNIGLQILSTFRPVELQEAIIKEDFARIARVKGIGPKLARRIVLEIKGLVTDLFGSEPKPSVTGEPLEPGLEEALAALQKLGYPRRSAAHALQEVAREDPQGKEPQPEELVRAALRIL